MKTHTQTTGKGSVLIIVLWVCFGLVSLTLYFAHSMSLELRASQNRAAALEAEMAIAGAARYVSNVLAQVESPGEVPEPDTYGREAMPVGHAYFWLLGRPQADDQPAPDQATFALLDEASRVNLNTAPLEMLEALPGMTAELAAAIIDWRDEDSDVTSGGAEDDTYLRLTPARHCKNEPFETVGELRLVMGAELDILFGEDTNLNGVLDPNENDGDISPPLDNRNGLLEAGLLEYVTVHSREFNLREDGTQKIDVTDNERQALVQYLQETLGQERATQILARLNGPPINSLLAFYMRSGMTEDEWSQVSGDLATTDEPYSEGLINVNTASEEVLAAIPGIGEENASALVAHRQSSAETPTSLAWVGEVLEPEAAQEAGPFLTARSHQFTADVAAVGRHGRGYRRVRLVFDTTEGSPKSILRQDFSHLGWALGWRTRQLLEEEKEDVAMSAFSSRQRLSTILGLSFEESQVLAVLVRRKNGGFQVQKTMRIALGQHPLTGHPETLGRDIRKQLDQGGVRASRCVVSLPLKWTSTVTTALPDLPEPDLASFLDLEAERGFLFAQENLAIRQSRVRCPSGARHATLVAVSHQNIQVLERILKAARLKPLSIVPGLFALQSPEHETSQGVLALTLRDRAIDLQVTCGGGVMVMRSLDVITSPEGGAVEVDVPRLRRELRITLGQLPADVRGLVRKARVFGDAEKAGPLVRDLTALFKSMGMSCDLVSTCGETPLKGLLPPEQAYTSALVVAVNRLRQTPCVLEFLPPRTSAWRRASEKVHARKLAWAGGALGGLILLGAGLFLYQQWQLSRLGRQWSAMEPTVEELGALQSRIKQFRSWYDASLPSLRILRGLTEAFPETGVVTAKTIEVRDLNTITCSGEAGNRQAILDMLDQLSADEEVQQLKVDQIRGKDPMQFTINFQWGTGGAGE